MNILNISLIGLSEWLIAEHQAPGEVLLTWVDAGEHISCIKLLS